MKIHCIPVYQKYTERIFRWFHNNGLMLKAEAKT